MSNFFIHHIKTARFAILTLAMALVGSCSLLPTAATTAPVPVATQAAAAPAKLAATATKAPTNTAAPAPTKAPTATTVAKQPTVAPTVTATTGAEAEQFGILGDVTQKVLVQPSPKAVQHPGVFGESLPKGAVLSTDATGRARILLQNGSTVRLAPNTQLTLVDRQQPETGTVLSQLNLLVGKVWAILGRGADESLTIETPIGVGAVRGSFLSVEYIPGKPNDFSDDILIVTCLEGDCSLTTSLGTIKLTTGQKIIVIGKGGQPDGPNPMTQQDIQDWLDNNVEILILFGITPGQLPDSLGPFTIQLPGGGVLIILPTPTSEPTATAGPSPTAGSGGSTLPTVAPAAGVPWPNRLGSNTAGLAIVAFGLVIGVAGRGLRKRHK